MEKDKVVGTVMIVLSFIGLVFLILHVFGKGWG